MGDHRVNQLLSLINQQVENQEILAEHLTKAEALAMISTGDSFLDWPKSIIHHYLWSITDILEQARTMNEHYLDRLLKESHQVMLNL